MFTLYHKDIRDIYIVNSKSQTISNKIHPKQTQSLGLHRGAREYHNWDCKSIASKTLVITNVLHGRAHYILCHAISAWGSSDITWVISRAWLSYYIIVIIGITLSHALSATQSFARGFARVLIGTPPRPDPSPPRHYYITLPHRKILCYILIEVARPPRNP